jgi:ATP-dependent Clp protease ATP-binding subunit ClpA
LSDECKRILAYAKEESERLQHRLIGTEHLFLGILREEGCLAAQVFFDTGVSLDAAREAVAQSLPAEGPGRTDLHPPADHFRELAAMFQTEERTPSVRCTQDGTTVVETRRSIASHQVSIKEQFQLSSDGKKLRYTHEVIGPRPEQRYSHTYDFDLSRDS